MQSAASFADDLCHALVEVVEVARALHLLPVCLPMQARRKELRSKKQVVEEQWRAKVNKEERKKRYVEQGHAEKRKALLASGGGGKYKKSRKE